MTDEDRYAEHNALVQAFRDIVQPLADAMTDEQCREIATAMQTESIGANTIGTRMRPLMGDKWDAFRDVTAGIILCDTAFARLDIRDMDFNPGRKSTLADASSTSVSP